MRTPFGFSLEFGIGKNFLPSLMIYRQKWIRLKAKIPFQTVLDLPDTLTNAHFIGIKFDLHIGTWKRPVRKFWTKDNPWISGNHWFVLHIPVMIGAFFSTFIRINKKRSPGLYIGTKSYRVDQISCPNTSPNQWAELKEQGSIYLCPSLTVRSDLIH